MKTFSHFEEQLNLEGIMVSENVNCEIDIA